MVHFGRSVWKNSAQSKITACHLHRTIDWMAKAHSDQASLPITSENRSRARDMVRSLRHRNLQLFFSGQLISLVGTWMQNIAQAWLVYRLTGASLLLGAGRFGGQIPGFFLRRLG